MSDDLVERLRNMADPKRVGSHFNPLYGDAADEIERLRDERDHWQALVSRADRVLFPFPAAAGTGSKT